MKLKEDLTDYKKEKTKLNIVFRSICEIDEYDFKEADDDKITKYADALSKSIKDKDESTYLKLISMINRYYGINFKATKVLDWDSDHMGFPEIEYKSIKPFSSEEELKNVLDDLDWGYILEDPYTKINGKKVIYY